MSNQLYPKFKEALLGGLSLTTGTVKALLVNTSSADGAGNFYSYSAAHDFLDDVPVSARIGTPQTLASKTTTAGVFDAADVTFPSVPSGSNAEAIVIYVDTAGADGTDPLVAYIDTAGNLPITPNGGNIAIAWDAQGIFAL